MAEASRRLSEFANHYRDRAHQNQRAGPVSAALPSVSEIDDHLGYVRNLQESMMRIRSAAEQTALEAQSQHHSHFKDVNGYESGPPPPPAHYSDAEQKQNFTGGDLMTKKRRTVSRSKHLRTWSPQHVYADTFGQRAAPPGRCHSCKRSETPEWRRGPDGARTLCNACGLRMQLFPLNLAILNLTTNRLCQVDSQSGQQSCHRFIELETQKHGSR